MSPLYGILFSLATFVQPLILGLVLIPIVRASASRLGLLDAPTLARKQHETPTPRTGGIAIYCAFWISLIVDYFIARFVLPGMQNLPVEIRTLAANVSLRIQPLLGLLIGSTVIFVLGLVDDRYNLPPLVRLFIQVLACVPLIATGTVLKLFLGKAFAIVITVLWVVLLTNSFNFLDNMNGLSSGVAIIICGVMGLISLLSQEWYMMAIFAMFAGAVFAFWMFNFPKASIFLGDAGSTQIGYFLAALSILITYYRGEIPSPLPVLIPLITFGVPIFDTLSVMWIRWRGNRPLMVGDTNHFSHRLVALGMSRTEAVLFIYGATLVLGLAAIPLRQLDAQHGIVLTVALCLIFLLLHWLERVSYRRHTPSPPSR